MALTRKLTAIADAIRVKTGDSNLLTLDQMQDAILNIPSGGGGGNEDVLIAREIKEDYSNSTAWAIGPYAFASNTGMPQATFEMATSVMEFAFYKCDMLEQLNLPEITDISPYAFADCLNLRVLNLYSPNRTAPPNLSDITAFENTLIEKGSGYVVINDGMADAWIKYATNWSLLPSNVFIGHTDAVNQGIVSA